MCLIWSNSAASKELSIMIQGFQFEVLIYARIKSSSLHHILLFILSSLLAKDHISSDSFIERYTFCEYILRTFLARSRESLLTRRIESTAGNRGCRNRFPSFVLFASDVFGPSLDSPILCWLVLVDYTWPSRMLRKIMSPSKRIPTRPSSRAIVLAFFLGETNADPLFEGSDGYLLATYIDRRKLRCNKTCYWIKLKACFEYNIIFMYN